MTQSTAAKVTSRRPAPAQRTAAPRPLLQLVSPLPRPGSNVPFVLLCSFFLAAGLIAVLLLNMSLERGAYELQGLQARSAVAGDRAAALQEELAAQSAPLTLAERATKLGLVPSTSAMFLSLPDGRVLGVPSKVRAAKPLTVIVDPPKPSASPTTAAPGGQAAGGQGSTAAR